MNNPSAPGPGERISAEQADKALEIEFGGLKRNLVGWQARALAWLGAGYVVVHLLILNVHPIDPWIFRTFHVSIGSVIGFAIYAAIPTDRGRIAWYDWTMMAASVAILAYIAVNLDDLLFRAGVLPTFWDMVVGIAGTAMVMELTRRAAGLALSWVGTGRLIFSLNHDETSFAEVEARFVSAAAAMMRDGWWWEDPALPPAARAKALARRLRGELLRAALRRIARR